MKRFFERYEKLCAEHGISPTGKQMQRALGVSGSTIAFWKSRNTMPKILTLQKIADYFNVSVAFLTGADDGEQANTSPVYPIDDFEKQIVETYRALSPKAKYEMFRSLVKIQMEDEK